MTQMELENEFDIEALLEAPYKKAFHLSLPNDQQECKAPSKAETSQNNEINKKEGSEEKKPSSHNGDTGSSKSNELKRGNGESSRYRYSEKESREYENNRKHARSDSREISRDRRRRRSRSRSHERHRRSHYSPEPRRKHDDRDHRKSSRYSKSPEEDRRRRKSPIRRKSPSPPEPANPQERDRRTVFCQQLSARLQNRDLYDFLSACGRIREAKIVMDKMSRRSKGVAYVEFYNEESVPKAIGMTGQKLFGIPIIVSASESDKNVEAEQKAAAELVEKEREKKEKAALQKPEVMTNKLLVGNLAMAVTEEDLTIAFSECGKLDSVKLQVDSFTGRSKGFALINYKTTYDARYAIKKLHGSTLKGKEIEVRPLKDSEIKQSKEKDLDDSEVQGVSLNSLSRVELMAKLARGDELTTKGIPTPGLGSVKDTVTVRESECIVLKNMFDSKEITSPNLVAETEADVKGECSKYGKIKHIAVDPESKGFIYLKFEDIVSAQKAITALNGRYFAGREISAGFLSTQTYQAKYPAA